MTIMLMTPQGIYLSRDKLGRTPIMIGKKEDGFCASFESFAYLNLGYEDFRRLGPGEIAVMTPDGVTTLSAPGSKMRICGAAPKTPASPWKPCASGADSCWRGGTV